jgi:hypothetical protein
VVTLALLAVAAVGCGAAFRSTGSAAAWTEFGLLLVVGAIVGLGRRAHLHDRWISARFLAERLRSGCMLAVAGVQRGPGDLERGVPGRGDLEWIGRGFTEVWMARPRRPEEPPVEDLRRYVVEAWLDDQARYHERTALRCERRHRHIEVWIVALFGLTVLAAFLHGAHILGHDATTGELLLFAAIFLPGLAGALGAIEVDGEFRRNAERSTETARRLREAARRMRAAQDLASIRAQMVEVEQLMDSEHKDWYAVMKFHDFEPPA